MKISKIDYLILSFFLIVSLLVILYFAFGSYSTDGNQGKDLSYVNVFLGGVFIISAFVVWVYPLKFIFLLWNKSSRKENYKRILFLILFPFISGYIIAFSCVKSVQFLDAWAWGNSIN